VIAVIALGVAALGDTVRHWITSGERRDGRAPTAETTDERAALTPRLPGVAAPGLIAFTVPGSCELRAFDLRSGRAVELPRLATTCELSAPRAGTRVAYSVGGAGGMRRTFGVRDLAHPRATFGEHDAVSPFAWSLDGSRLAWCDTVESGFELSLGRRPKRLHYCPRAYDPRGVTASLNGQQVLAGGRPLLTARRAVRDLAWGVDGSLAVLVDGRRVDRYVGGRLVGATILPPPPAEPITMGADLARDNCAALVRGASVVRLVDLGCFRGRAPQTFKGVYADWSPDGEWVAVVEPGAVVFHRVVGREATVPWNVAAGQLAWLGG
jgi:hypothetical protein